MFQQLLIIGEEHFAYICKLQKIEGLELWKQNISETIMNVISNFTYDSPTYTPVLHKPSINIREERERSLTKKCYFSCHLIELNSI